MLAPATKLGLLATKSSTTNTTPYAATASETLAGQLQHLLLRFGIVSRLTRKRFPYKEGRDGFTLHLVGRRSIERFADAILPHVVGREPAVTGLRAYLLNTPPDRESVDTLPAEVKAWVQAAQKRSGQTWKQVEAQSGVCVKEFYGAVRPHKKGFRRATIQALGDYFQDRELQQIAAAELYWERIEAIEADGVEMTYDLEVEATHNFVANDLIVHNSHSAAYALVSYQTAWLKTHHPAAFMAAVLSSDLDNTDKVVVLLEECRHMDLEVLPPDINQSHYRFTVGEPGRVVYGLGAIKGVGEAAIEGILKEREENGVYRDLFDLCARSDLKKANKRVLEHLIHAGALDCFGETRATHEAWLPAALQTAEQQAHNAAAGQNDLFGLGAPAAKPADDKPADLEPQAEWDENLRLSREKEVLGLYLSGHPINRYLDELRRFAPKGLAELMKDGDEMAAAGGGPSWRRGRDEKKTIAAGLVMSIRIRKQKNGRMGFLTLDDRTGRLEAKLFDKTFDEFRDLIEKDRVIVVEGKLGYDDFAGCAQITVDTLYDLDGARERFAKGIRIQAESDGQADGIAAALAEALGPYRSGRCAVTVEYARPDVRGTLRLGEAWRVKPTDELLRRLRASRLIECAEIRY